MSCIIKDLFFEEPFEGVEYEMTVHIMPIHGKKLVFEHEFIIQSLQRMASLFIYMENVK